MEDLEHRILNILLLKFPSEVRPWAFLYLSYKPDKHELLFVNAPNK